jgi:cbb3-type cytochrome oxidase subunit 3
MPDPTDKPKAATPPADANEATEPEAPKQKPPHIVMRALMGFAGLSLLVGFFLPWVRFPAVAAEEGTSAVPEHFQNGLDLLMAHDIQGTTPMAILLVPILGACLSAVSFMGFRYAAQTAIAVAVGMLAYGLYVLGSMFVQFTGYGLWTVAGGTFVILLLGVIAYMFGRRTDDKEEEEEAADKPKADAPKAAAKA